MSIRPPLLLLGAILILVCRVASAESPAIPLDAAEEEWLQRHPIVRLGVDPAWPPFSYVDKHGKNQGIDADLLTLIATRLGIRFDLVPTTSWAETELHAMQHQVELVPGAAQTEERAKQLIFTKPYLSAPVAVIMRNDAPFWIGLHALDGRTFAAARRHVTTQYLAEHHPQIRLLLMENVGDALEQVAQGNADGVLANLVVAAHLIKTRGLQNLKIVGLVDQRFDLRFAVSKHEPELRTILDKALDSITEREHAAILDRWISVNIEDAIHWQLIRRIGLWVLLLGGAGWWWNRRLARELEARRKVESELREREASLSAANRELAALNEHRRNLMNMVAHDLRNPLSSITVGCDLLAVMPQITPAATAELDSISTAADRMVQLVSDLLSAEAIEQGARSFSAEAVVWSDLISPLVERVRSLARMKEIALTCAMPLVGCRIRADATALAQVAENLLSNALKFTPRGGRVTLTVETRADAVRMSVADSGPGVAAADRIRLFEKFARLSARPTGGEASTGLGLAIVKLLVTRMGGTIHYEDAPGGGACFVVSFPRFDDPDLPE